MQGGSLEGWACGQNPSRSQELGCGICVTLGQLPALSVPVSLLVYQQHSGSVGKDFPLCWENRLEEGMAAHCIPQCSCLENPMDRGAWWATVHWVTKSRTPLSD